ncbi:MAG: ATP-binding cassette domain-containing protein, partial [Marinovum sp.]|nr:ATP-binding cassette domain-containing protein [Marinovum sp.]
MNKDILRLQGIDKAYNRGLDGEVTVLKGLNLAIAPAQVVALVAPSGAGKSTLLHIAGLLDTADSGQLEIDGVNMCG